jgi:hypothetical protein
MNDIPLVDGSKLKIHAKVNEASQLIANLFPLCIRNSPKSWESILPKTLDRGLLENLKKLVDKFQVISEAEVAKWKANPTHPKSEMWVDFQGVSSKILDKIEPIDISVENPRDGSFLFKWIGFVACTRFSL